MHFLQMTKSKNVDFVLKELELDFHINWIQNNHVHMNSDACHLFVTGHKFEQIWGEINM